MRPASNRQPRADDRQRAGQDRTQHAVGTREANWLPIAIPRMERSAARRASGQSMVPMKPMARAGDQGQGHGMRNIGADDAHRRQFRIEHQQSGDAGRAGADRDWKRDDDTAPSMCRERVSTPGNLATCVCSFEAVLAGFGEQATRGKNQAGHVGDEKAKPSVVRCDVARSLLSWPK